MATNVTINSQFKGVPAGQIIGSIFREANTLKDRLINVIPDVVGSGFLRRTNIVDGLLDYSCGFTPSGSIDLTEVEITPKKFKVNIEICKETFRSRWSAAQMGFSAWNDVIPADEQEAIMLELSNSVSSKIETNIWNGLSATSGQFQGLLPKMVADSTVVKVGTPVAITPLNVAAQMGRTLDLVKDAVVEREDFIFGVSKNIHRAFVRANGATNSNYQADTNNFEGYEIRVIAGLPANTMVLYNQANVSFLTGLESDSQEVRIKDMDDISGTIRVGMVFTAGVGYAYGGDIVLYKTA